MKKVNAKDYLGKIVEIKIDRPLGSRHPKHGFMYNLNYGYVPNTISGDGEELDAYLIEKLKPFMDTKISSIVLGCTHYPFAKKAIEAVVGKDVQIFDGGEGTAREMRRRMQCASLINPSKEKGTVKFINSKDTEEERELCEFLLNLKM